METTEEAGGEDDTVGNGEEASEGNHISTTRNPHADGATEENDVTTASTTAHTGREVVVVVQDADDKDDEDNWGNEDAQMSGTNAILCECKFSYSFLHRTHNFPN